MTVEQLLLVRQRQIPLHLTHLWFCSSATSRVLASKHLLMQDKRGVAHISFATIQPAYKRGVACILLMYHAPFINNYSKLT